MRISVFDHVLCGQQDHAPEGRELAQADDAADRAVGQVASRLLAVEQQGAHADYCQGSLRGKNTFVDKSLPVCGTS